MKKRNKTRFPIAIIAITAIIFILAASCTENKHEDSLRLVTAKVTNDNKNEVVATFNKDIYTRKDGFTIWIEDEVVSITGIEGSGTNSITFQLSKNVEFSENVYIEYDASIGLAEDVDGKNLRSFSKTEVRNYIEKFDLSVLLPSIPPEVKGERVWFILKTDENPSNWASDYATANSNEILSAKPGKTPFDLIVHITKNPDWRPNMAFDSGYYATILGSSNEYIQYKVVSWVKENGLTSTDMGHIVDISTDEMNYSYEKAFSLAIDGKDYVEGNISGSTTHWYKFYGVLNQTYTIYLEDYWTNNNYSGKVEAVIMDVYRIPYEDLEPILSGHPQTITGNDENIYIEVQVSERGGITGSYHIQVIEN